MAVGNYPGQQSVESQVISKLKTDPEKNRRLLQMNKTAGDFWHDWQLMAEESYGFIDGAGQWTESEKEYLRVMKRTPIVINKIFAPVMYVSGIQRRMRQEPRLVPTEVTDQNATALMGGLLRWSEDLNRITMVDSQVFLDKLICGLGWWKYSMDFRDKLEGVPVVERVRPFNVYPDPNFVTDGWDNANYVFHDQWVTLEDAEVQFPDFKKLMGTFGADGARSMAEIGNIFSAGWDVGDPLAGLRNFWEPETSRVRLQEAWYKTKIPTRLLLVRDDMFGDITTVQLDDRKMAIFEATVGQLPAEEQAKLTVVKRPVTVINRAYLIGGLLMEDEPSPYKDQHFPLFPSVGYVFNRHPFGLVEQMKWPQKEKNARRSKMAEIVAKSPVTIWKNKQSGGANPVDLRNVSKGVGNIIQYETVPPEEVKARDMPEGLVRLEGIADAEIALVTGINSSGNVNAEGGGSSISGRHLDNFQRQGLTAQDYLFDTFQMEKAVGVKFEINLLKQFVGGGRAMRILGARVSNQQESEAAIVDIMTGGTVEDLQRVYSAAFTTEFDVTVAFKPSEPSAKIGLLKLLIEVGKELGYPISPDVLTDVLVQSGVMDKGMGDRMKADIQQQQQVSQQQALGGAAVVQGQPQGQLPPGAAGGLPAELLEALQQQGGGAPAQAA